MDLELANQVVVVIGGASGIGRASVRKFVAAHARVDVWDIADDVDQIAAADGATGQRVDVTQRDELQRAHDEAVARLGPVNHLVHAAAIGSGRYGFPFTELTPADWASVLDVNVMGMVNVADVITPAMVDRGQGTMVFLSSVAGQIGSPTDPPYSAAKAANINFAQCMARDLAAHGIRVNTVCPGMVRTPLNRSVWQSWLDRQEEPDRLSYDEWAQQKIAALVPLGRWQEAEDVADMIVFLSSARAAQVTGQTVNVDGGQVMHW